MSAPPAKRSKECSTISMVVGKGDCFSPSTRISGYPWRLRLFKRSDGYWMLLVICEKSMEAELWECEAVVRCNLIPGEKKCKFISMDKKSQAQNIGVKSYSEGTHLEVEITPYDDGNKWRSRPIVGLFEARDGILVIEDKKLHVNKESLASQSSYFERLFKGDFKEKSMNEISIGDVSFEEFSILMKIVYGENGGGSTVEDLLTRENVHTILELADRFELKIVEDGVLNSLLSSYSPFSIHESLLIAEQHNLTMFKDRILSQYTNAQLKELSESPEVSGLSFQTVCALFRKSWENPR